MKTFCATILLAASIFAQVEDPGNVLLNNAKQLLPSPEAESDLRQALALWNRVEPKPPQYLEALGLFGVMLEGRLIKTPNELHAELEPLLEDATHRIMSPGFPGNGLMAARVLDLYAILLQRTGRAYQAAPVFARAEALRFPPHATPAGLNPLKSGNGVSTPSLLKSVAPQSSQDALRAAHQGTVVLSVVVGEDGTVKDVHIVHYVGLGLDEQAIKAVSQWTFRPAHRDGVPVPVQTQVEVNFRSL